MVILGRKSRFRSLLQLGSRQRREIIRSDSGSRKFGIGELVVHHQRKNAGKNSPHVAVAQVVSDRQNAFLLRFDPGGGQSYVQVGFRFRIDDRHVERTLRIVIVFDGFRFDRTARHISQIHRTGRQPQRAGPNGVQLADLLRTRGHLAGNADDITPPSAALNRDVFAESARTSLRVVGDPDRSAASGTYRFPTVLRRRTTARHRHFFDHDRRFPFVLEFELVRHRSVRLPDRSEIPHLLRKFQYGILGGKHSRPQTTQQYQPYFPAFHRFGRSVRKIKHFPRNSQFRRITDVTPRIRTG